MQNIEEFPIFYYVKNTQNMGMQMHTQFHLPDYIKTKAKATYLPVPT